MINAVREGNLVLLELEDGAEFKGWVKEKHSDKKVIRLDDVETREDSEKDKEYRVFVAGNRFYSIIPENRRITRIKRYKVLI